MIPTFSEFIFEDRDSDFLKKLDKEFDSLKDGEEFLYRGIRLKVIDRNEGVLIGIRVGVKYEDSKPILVNKNMFKNYGNIASKK
jgi:hypothetical protein